MRRHGKLIVALMAAVALLGIGSVAEAQQTPQTVDHPGPGKGGTNEDGTCETLQDGEPAPSPGNQIWQFNLTPQQDPQNPLLSATFSDGTVVAGQMPADSPSAVFFFFVETSLGAALESASVTFTGDDPPPRSRLVVSHCNIGEDGTTTTTSTTTTSTTTTTVPGETTTTTTVPGETTTTTTGPSAVQPPAPPAAAPAQPVPGQPNFVG